MTTLTGADDQDRPLPGLRSDNPHYVPAVSVSRSQDPVADTAMTMYLNQAAGTSGSQEELAQVLTSPLASTIVVQAFEYGTARAQSALDPAEAALNDASADNDHMKELSTKRASLPKDKVDLVGTLTTREDVMKRKPIMDKIAGIYVLTGRGDHLERPDPPWRSWGIAAIITGLEAFVTARVFGVDLSRPGLALFSWLILTLASLFWNHLTITWLARAIRKHRNLRDSTVNLTEEALHRTHPLGGVR